MLGPGNYVVHEPPADYHAAGATRNTLAEPLQKPTAALRERPSSKIIQDLTHIEPSHCGPTKYFPCAATLRDGSVQDCVYLVSQAQYIRVWGSYPEDDRRKSSIRIQDIESVVESPNRLLAKIANRIYEAGESGMGYTVFTLVFGDGSRQSYLTGDAVDFIDYPDGKTANDVLEVLPHVGRDTQPRSGRPYYWCLYSDDDTERAFQLGLTEPQPRGKITVAQRLRWLWRRIRYSS